MCPPWPEVARATIYRIPEPNRVIHNDATNFELRFATPRIYQILKLLNFSFEVFFYAQIFLDIFPHICSTALIFSLPS